MRLTAAHDSRSAASYLTFKAGANLLIRNVLAECCCRIRTGCVLRNRKEPVSHRCVPRLKHSRSLEQAHNLKSLGSGPDTYQKTIAIANWRYCDGLLKCSRDDEIGLSLLSGCAYSCTSIQLAPHPARETRILACRTSIVFSIRVAHLPSVTKCAMVASNDPSSAAVPSHQEAVSRYHRLLPSRRFLRDLQ